MNNNDYIHKYSDILSFRELADGTIATYISYLRIFLDWISFELDGKPVPDVSWEEIRSFCLFLKNVKHLNPRTINVYIAQLRDFFIYVLHKDWDIREVPYLHYDEHLPSFLTVPEVNRLIDSFTNIKHKAEIALLYSSGIRVSELCRLHCGDIYLAKKHIYISKSKNRSDRYAVLADRVVPILKEYIRREYASATKDDWLFPGQMPGSHISTQSIYNELIRQYAALGWKERGFNCHTLRHSFGLHLYEAGTDLMTIKEAMGHKSISSTTIYLTLGIGNGRSVTSPYDL